jgi:hypothetical protein
MSDQDFFWLVGLLEGEGSFSPGPPSAPNLVRISLHMTDEDIVAKVASLWGQSYHRVQQARAERMGWKSSYQVLVRGRPALELMKLMLPYMGQRRQGQIERALPSYNPHLRRKLAPEQIVEIKAQLAVGRKHGEIAKQYGVDRSTISHIKAGTKPAYR